MPFSGYPPERGDDEERINTVGARIKACRKEMGYSQETLAALLYMKKTTICRYEKDEHEIPSSVIVDLAKALHTTPNYLLMGESDEDSWTEDMLNILEKITDPAMRTLAMKQLKCIVEI